MGPFAILVNGVIRAPICLQIQIAMGGSASVGPLRWYLYSSVLVSICAFLDWV
jgi:hypothetical protein